MSGRSRGGFKGGGGIRGPQSELLSGGGHIVLLVERGLKFHSHMIAVECFASFCPGAPALHRRRDPKASWVSVEEQAQTSLLLERCRGWRRRSWLHKHPHPSTCPRLPSPWLLPLILTDLGARVPKLVAPFARYPQSKLEDRNLRLRALESLALPSQPWEKGLDFRGLSHLSVAPAP